MKASSLVEVLVAMVIVMIGFSALVVIGVKVSNTARIHAKLKVNFLVKRAYYNELTSGGEAIGIPNPAGYTVESDLLLGQGDSLYLLMIKVQKEIVLKEAEVQYMISK